MTAGTAGVGVMDVLAMGATVVSVVKPLEGCGGLQMAFHRHWLLIHRGWIASGAPPGVLWLDKP